MKIISIIGGGPSGLMAADILSANGYKVIIYDRKPTFGRKFLMAGRGGLNISHSENLDDFIKKYGLQSNILKKIINNFSPQNLRDWCQELGEKTFIGSSGRIFPQSFKASPLLRAWLARLKKQEVTFKTNHDWQGWKNDSLIFNTKSGKIFIKSDLIILSLGGASWPDLGSDGSWVKILEDQDVQISPLQPSNCGFVVEWTKIFSKRFEGKFLKSVLLSFQEKKVLGEFIITKNGVEGTAIYALSSLLREEINNNGEANLILDLKPDLNIEEILKRLKKPQSKLSMSNYLRKTLNLSDVAIGLLMELPDRKNFNNFTPEKITRIIKSYTLNLKKPFSIIRAISTAGGVTFNSIDDNFMLINKPNVFIAGEMLDWEAPTGGYLLQACIANGAYVANTIIKKNI
ncbi:TIGR03862 family flavoprotein [Alphaproteobacteria bacterium]|nr:TIGR03862 family flavoprotein [Alphaproteobacteria bacterium]